MQSFSYGTRETASPAATEPPGLVELRHRGFCVIPDVVAADALATACAKLDAVYAQQEREAGRETLVAIGEIHLARLPLEYDDWFLSLATQPRVLQLVRSLIGDYIILHLQNGILNMPQQRHHQAAWHRDLPHQEWTISTPLAVSALFCLDPFTVENGCTHVLPHSHQWPRLPPVDYVEKHAVPVPAAAGSVILFDCMLCHRAGENRSAQVRRGVNHVYTIPLLKQQIDLPRALGPRPGDDPELARLLGYTSQVPASVGEWRRLRQQRAKR
jgi:ectoine hydroxylase-related dioxygenase (phytanoyl-CoA dioxygenase family)